MIYFLEPNDKTYKSAKFQLNHNPRNFHSPCQSDETILSKKFSNLPINRYTRTKNSSKQIQLVYLRITIIPIPFSHRRKLSFPVTLLS